MHLRRHQFVTISMSVTDNMLRKDSYWLFLSQPIAWYLFIVITSWAFCKPIIFLENYREIITNEVDPITVENSTCFIIDHGNAIFFDYPPLGENRILFGILIMACIFFQSIVIAPFLRLRKSNRK